MSTETQPYFNKTRGELTTKLTRLNKLHVRRVCTEVTLKCVLNKKLQDEREKQNDDCKDLKIYEKYEQPVAAICQQNSKTEAICYADADEKTMR